MTMLPKASRREDPDATRDLHHLADQARRLLAALEIGDDRAIRAARTALTETIGLVTA